jgi:integrase
MATLDDIRRGPLQVRCERLPKRVFVRLTERIIASLAVGTGGRDRLVFDNQQRGLAVRVTASGGRTYLCQYTLHGRKWRVPLGACSAVPLFRAREAAAAIMGDVAKGRNPAAERKEAAAIDRARRARNRLTLRMLIDDWNRLHLADRRPSYAAEAVRALHHALAPHLDDAAEDLDRATVVRALDALTRLRKRKDGGGVGKLKGTAIKGRTAAYGRAAFSWAVKRGELQHNPFANLPVAKGIAKRERVLSDIEIAEIWRASGDTAPPYGSIIRLLILTGQRRGEVAGIAWNELTEALATWNLPGNRTKNGVAHAVPLSAPTRRILKSFCKDSHERHGLVLPGEVGNSFAGWSKAKKALDNAIIEARARAAEKAGTKAAALVPWSVHDLRRTVATGLQRLGVRLEVTEAVLNHISGTRGGIAGVYQRHDWAVEKRAAIDAWAAHVISICQSRNEMTNARLG